MSQSNQKNSPSRELAGKQGDTTTVPVGSSDAVPGMSLGPTVAARSSSSGDVGANKQVGKQIEAEVALTLSSLGSKILTPQRCEDMLGDLVKGKLSEKTMEVSRSANTTHVKTFKKLEIDAPETEVIEVDRDDIIVIDGSSSVASKSKNSTEVSRENGNSISNIHNKTPQTSAWQTPPALQAQSERRQNGLSSENNPGKQEKVSGSGPGGGRDTDRQSQKPQAKAAGKSNPGKQNNKGVKPSSNANTNNSVSNSGSGTPKQPNNSPNVHNVQQNGNGKPKDYSNYRCHRCGELGHISRACRTSGNQQKKEFKMQKIKEEAVSDLVDQLDGAQDALEAVVAEVNEAAEDIEAEEEEEPRVYKEIEVRKENGKLVDRIEDTENRCLLLQARDRGYLEEVERDLMRLTANMEHSTATLDSTPFFVPIEPMAGLKRKMKMRCLMTLIISFGASLFMENRFGFIISFLNFIIVFFLFYFHIFVNKLYNSTYDEAVVFRTYRVNRVHHTDPTQQIEQGDQRASGSASVDITRVSPVFGTVMCDDGLLVPSLRPTITGIGVFYALMQHYRPSGRVLGWIWDRLFPRIQRLTDFNCRCRQLNLPCKCDHMVETRSVLLTPGVTRLTVSLEVLTEILSANPVIKDKTTDEVRSTLLSTSRRLPFINLNRYTAIKAMIPQTVEFGTVVVINQMRRNVNAFPQSPDLAGRSGSFSV